MIARPQSVSPASRGNVLAGLREALAFETPQGAGAIAFGIPSLDAALGGGLAKAALHEIAAVRAAEIPAATGFALILAVHSRGPVVWIAEDMALAEYGAPYGPGLEELGLAPERLIAVQAAKSRDVLWAMEEALGSTGGAGALGAVIGEVRGGIDFLGTRRLSLAASRSSSLAVLLRGTPANEPSAAATRLLVGAAPSCPPNPSLGGEGWSAKPTGWGVRSCLRLAPPGSSPGAGEEPPSGAAPETASPKFAFGPGPPRFCVCLVRNRRGPTGEWMVEFDRVEQRFAPADFERLAQAARNRPHQAASA
jgi:protein ImuA